MCVCLIFSVSSVHAISLNEEGDNYLFQGSEDVVRGFLWGLPQIAILDNEKGTLISDEGDLIFYLDNVLGARSVIGYEFNDDKLWRVKIFNERKYSVPQDRIEALLSYQKILEARYGEPLDEQFMWRSEYEKNHPDNWGWAVYRGNLAIKILWQTEDSIVTLSLKTPKQYKPEMVIAFTERKTEAKIQDDKEKLGIMAPSLAE